VSNLLTEQKWVGEFFLPGSHDSRFSGELQYTPEEGIVLSYLISHDAHMESSEVLHGILSSGEKCTLIGNFDPSKSGLSLNNDLATRPGQAWFQFLIHGAFIPTKGQITNLDFSLTNLQDFFYPSYAKNRVKYSPIPDYTLSTHFGNIKVGTKATFNPLTNDITNQIYSQNKSALQELQDQYLRISKKYRDSRFMLKSEISYSINLDLLRSSTALEAFKIIFEIADLFSLLTYSPVYPEYIQILDESITTPHGKIFLYPSMLATQKIIKIATREQSHRNMPIRKNTIPLDQIISNWLSNQYDFSILISSIQNDSEIVNIHEAHGETTLYATQLESIGYLANKSKYDRYEYPIKTYANDTIIDGLSRIFSVGTTSDIAVSISELRNEIAHVQKPKVLLKKLRLKEMVRINQYLQLTIIGYILNQIGVPTDVISNYQDHHAPPHN